MIRDIRQAFRSIRRMPVLAAVVVVSLAAGIGANTVVFSWVEAVTLRPVRGVEHSADLHFVEARTAAGGAPGSSWLEYLDLRRELRSLSDLLVYRMAPLYIGDPSAGLERVFSLYVSDNYFSALGVRPVRGRFPGRTERDAPVVVVSYGFWQRRFGGAADVVGRTLTVNGQALTVSAVAPREFQGTVLGLAFDIWVPATLAPQLVTGSRELEARNARGYSIMGFLGPESTRVQAQQDVEAAMARLAHDFPDSNTAVTADVLPILEALRGPQRMLGNALLALQALMLLLLAAVCGNTANLLLARASGRAREAAVRLALGSGRFRIVRLLAIESLLLAVLGAAGGALIAVWGTRGLLVLPLSGFPIRFEAPLDGLGLSFALALGLGCGLFFGAAPAWHLARMLPQSALRGGTVSAGSPRSNSLRHLLMGLQSGFAVIVLVVAALFLKAFLDTRTTDPGFRREGVLLAAYDLADRDRTLDVDGARRDTARRVLESVRAMPGVRDAAIASAVPLDIHGLPSRDISIDGRVRSDGASDEALTNTVTTSYFEVMEIAMVAGRRFSDLDAPRTEREAIVNVSFVRQYLDGKPPTEALGWRLRVNDRDYSIVGVVSDSLYNAFGEPPTPALYFSFRDRPQSTGEIHVRTRTGAEAALAGELRETLRRADPGTAVFNFRTLTEHVDSNLVLRRVPAQMFAVLGPLLLALAAIGIYAVVDYAVTRRTAEIGLRLAFGATTRQVVTGFVGEHMSTVGAGVLLGWLVALIIAIGFGAVDAVALAAVPATLLVVAAIACWIPVRRAVALDPTAALRAE